MIKLKNRKKENLKFQKFGKEFKEKLGGIWWTGIKLFQSKFWDSISEQWNLKKNFTKLGKIFEQFWKIVDNIYLKKTWKNFWEMLGTSCKIFSKHWINLP